VEGRNFDIRKQLLEYDDVANDQRKVIYEQRRELMDGEDISETVTAMRADVLSTLINGYIPPQSLEEQWDIPGLSQALTEFFGGDWPIQRWLDEDHELHEETLRERIADTLSVYYAEKEKLVGAATMRQIEKAVMLQTLDTQWKDHLAQMDYLRQGIHLRGYAQKNPKQEYKREAFEMFSAMLGSIKEDVVKTLSRMQVRSPEELAPELAPSPAREQEFQFQHESFTGLGDPQEAAAVGAGSERSQAGGRRQAGLAAAEQALQGDDDHQPYVRGERKVGRNEPCPCGSGKKYKQCCGKVA